MVTGVVMSLPVVLALGGGAVVLGSILPARWLWRQAQQRRLAAQRADALGTGTPLRVSPGPVAELVGAHDALFTLVAAHPDAVGAEERAAAHAAAADVAAVLGGAAPSGADEIAFVTERAAALAVLAARIEASVAGRSPVSPTADDAAAGPGWPPARRSTGSRGPPRPTASAAWPTSSSAPDGRPMADTEPAVRPARSGPSVAGRAAAPMPTDRGRAGRGRRPRPSRRPGRDRRCWPGCWRRSWSCGSWAGRSAPACPAPSGRGSGAAPAVPGGVGRHRLGLAALGRALLRPLRAAGRPASGPSAGPVPGPCGSAGPGSSAGGAGWPPGSGPWLGPSSARCGWRGPRWPAGPADRGGGAGRLPLVVAAVRGVARRDRRRPPQPSAALLAQPIRAAWAALRGRRPPDRRGLSAPSAGPSSDRSAPPGPGSGPSGAPGRGRSAPPGPGSGRGGGRRSGPRSGPRAAVAAPLRAAGRARVTGIRSVARTLAGPWRAVARSAPLGRRRRPAGRQRCEPRSDGSPRAPGSRPAPRSPPSGPAAGPLVAQVRAALGRPRPLSPSRTRPHRARTSSCRRSSRAAAGCVLGTVGGTRARRRAPEPGQPTRRARQISSTG